MAASGNIPLPPIPQKKYWSVIGGQPYAGERPCAIHPADEDRRCRAKLHIEA
jgi:hypothetical protein